MPRSKPNCPKRCFAVSALALHFIAIRPSSANDGAAILDHSKGTRIGAATMIAFPMATEYRSAGVDGLKLGRSLGLRVSGLRDFDRMFSAGVVARTWFGEGDYFLGEGGRETMTVTALSAAAAAQLRSPPVVRIGHVYGEVAFGIAHYRGSTRHSDYWRYSQTNPVYSATLGISVALGTSWIGQLAAEYHSNLDRGGELFKNNERIAFSIYSFGLIALL